MSEALDENYERAGYHYKQNLGLKPALLLVDFRESILLERLLHYLGVRFVR